jgi:uncharacterized protein YecE (DUF72 family)
MTRVGCCGFPTSTEKYFERFSLVELNSTFYHYPRQITAEGWRKKAPKSFEFTVKAHKDISHKAKLKVEETSLHDFERMKQVCKVLHSKILLIQTPSSFRHDRLGDAERFFREVDRGDAVLVWGTSLLWSNKSYCLFRIRSNHDVAVQVISVLEVLGKSYS